MLKIVIYIQRRVNKEKDNQTKMRGGKYFDA